MTTPLRVAMHYALPGGGIGRYVAHVMDEMLQLPELDLEFCCLPEFEYRSRTGGREWPGLATISHPFPPVRRFRFLRGQWLNPRRLLSHLEQRRPDVLHFCNVNHLFYGGWRARLKSLGAKIVMTAHDVRRASPILSRAREDANLIAFYRDCDALLVHTENQKADMVEFAGVSADRVHVVPHGPYSFGAAPAGTRERIRRELHLPAEAPVGLFFGYIKHYKGLDLLLEGMLAHDDGQHLIVAGKCDEASAPMVAEFQRRFEAAGRADSVRWEIGYVADDRVRDLVETCDYLVLPYRPEFTSSSGIFNIASEHRRPVVAAPTTGFSEVLARYRLGVLCADHSVESIMAGERQLRAGLARGDANWEFGRYVEECSWERNARLTQGIYFALAGRPMPEGVSA